MSKVSNKEMLMLILNKIISIPEFETEEELKQWLIQENARPPQEIIAETRKLIEETKQEVAKCEDLY